MDKSLRVILAARVSTEDQAAHGTSMDSQIEAGRDYARRIGATVVGTCIEPGVSGALYESREELQRCLKRLEDDEADAIVWYDVSRMSRDIEYIGAITRRIERAGKQALFCTEEYGDTADGFISKGIKGVLSHGERMKIKERTTGGTRRKALQGIQPKRHFSPYGYHIVTKDDIMNRLYPKEMEGKYAVVPEEIEVVVRMFQWCAQGMSLHAIAARLSLDGVPTKKGKPFWRYETVRKIMRSKVYLGNASFGKTKLRTDESRVKSGLRKSYQVKSDDADVVDIPVERTISDELFYAAQQRIEENQKLLAGRPTERRYLLPGLLRCPQCGRGMRCRPTTSKRILRLRAEGHQVDNYCYYVCAYAYISPHPEQRCTKTQYPMIPTNTKVLRQIVNALTQPDVLEAALAQQQKRTRPKTSATELARLRKKIEELAKREDSLVEGQLRAIEKGISTAVYERKLLEAARERTAVQQRVAEISTVAASEEAESKAVRTQAAMMRDMADAVTEVLLAPSSLVSDVEKYNVLLKIVKSVTPIGSGFRIEWRTMIE